MLAHLVSGLDRVLLARATGIPFWMSAAPCPADYKSICILMGAFGSKYLSTIAFHISSLILLNIFCSCSVQIVVEGKISYFGLARNLIRHLISPNQDDLSYSARTFHFRPANRVSCQT